MNVLITGGSGYLGRALTEYLIKPDNQAQVTTVTWVSRNADTKHPQEIQVITYDELSSTNQTFDIIVNLAGAGIAESRWSDSRKQIVLNSRLKPTQAILDYIERIGKRKDGMQQPKLFISGSAIGWYGAQQCGDTSILTEDSHFVEKDFAHELCDTWENLANTAINIAPDMPVAIVRTGIVLSGDGGMIGKLKLPFSLGLGGRLGSGQQRMSWISLRDWVRAVVFIIEKNQSRNLSKEQPQEQSQDESHKQSQDLSQLLQNQQVYNLTAPKPISNADFSKAVGSWLHRPTIFAQPELLLKLIFGEMATLLIDGQNIYPQKLVDLGFEFKDTEVLNCLKEIN